MTERGKCAKCGQDVFVQESKTGSKYYTNSEGKQKLIEHADGTKFQNWHSDTCPKKKVEQQQTPTEKPKVVEQPTKEEQREYQQKQEEKHGKLVQPELETASDRLEFERGFRTLQMIISKSRKITNETLPELGQYENLEYYNSQTVAIDNPNANIIQKARETFALINTIFDKEIEQDRLKLIKRNEDKVKHIKKD